jgi:hypothetical protein
MCEGGGLRSRGSRELAFANASIRACVSLPLHTSMHPQTRSSVPGQSPLPSLFGVDDVANAKVTSDITLNIHNSGENGGAFLEVRLT